MPTSVKMRHMGESVAEGTIAKWLKAEGEAVAKDEPLGEVTSDKVDYEIPAKEGPRGGAPRGPRRELRRMDRLRVWKLLVLGAAVSGLLSLTTPGDAAQGMEPHGKGAGEAGMDHLHALAVDPRDGTLLMGTHDGLHRSTDEGKTWTKVAPEGDFPGRDVMAIAADPKQPEILYAAGHDLGVVKSTDGGRRWLAALAGLPTMDVHALTLDPNDPRKLYAWVDLKGLYRSLDAGGRWARVDDGPVNPDVRVLLSVNIPTGMGGIYLYGGTSDGLFRSADCF